MCLPVATPLHVYVAHLVFLRDVWIRTQTSLKNTLRYRYRYEVPNYKVPNHKLPNLQSS